MTRYFWLLITTATILFSSCTKDNCTNEMTYVRYDPVFVTQNEYRKNVEVEVPKSLEQPGKIYFYKDYIFINELREGIHIINNQDPSNPVNERFIAIKGNVDMAIMNDYLYADSYTDLVILDLRNISNPIQVQRKEDVFSSHYHAGQFGILSHYTESNVTEKVDCGNEFWGSPWFIRGGDMMIDRASFDSSFGNISTTSSGAPAQVGQGGSMARFTISKSHLYALGNSELFSLQIFPQGIVGDAVRTHLPWGIETLFPYKEYLFVGASNGLHILSIENPSVPVYVSTFEHANACDPVVVQNDIAYVTLRSGNECQGFTDQLEVIDVKDVLKPKLLHTYKMDNPHGLAVAGDYLYLCEGKHGLKVFDIKDISKINQNLRSHIKGFHAWDAIAVMNRSLLVIGDDGFRQYDYTDPTNLKMLSLISIKK